MKMGLLHWHQITFVCVCVCLTDSFLLQIQPEVSSVPLSFQDGAPDKQTYHLDTISPPTHFSHFTMSPILFPECFYFCWVLLLLASISLSSLQLASHFHLHIHFPLLQRASVRLAAHPPSRSLPRRTSNYCFTRQVDFTRQYWLPWLCWRLLGNKEPDKDGRSEKKRQNHGVSERLGSACQLSPLSRLYNMF